MSHLMQKCFFILEIKTKKKVRVTDLIQILAVTKNKTTIERQIKRVSSRHLTSQEFLEYIEKLHNRMVEKENGEKKTKIKEALKEALTLKRKRNK